MTLSNSSRGFRILKPLAWLAAFAVSLLAGSMLKGQNAEPPIDDMTANYHFLSDDDTLAILDEEGRLKGYIEVAQPPEESDDILTFDIMEGSRKDTHVEFHTNRIHGKFYRFSGTVERGKGREDKDPDYLHLTGNLETVTVNGETGQETVQTVKVTLKSIGKSERPEE
ncbi:MAG: hypothetical protein WAO35_26895 [Terriglobia bacterium]